MAGQHRWRTESEWRADGEELYWLDPDGKIMAVDVRASEAKLQFGAPRTLFATDYAPEVWPDYLYDTVDGERFLVSEPVSGEHGLSTPGVGSVAQINVIIN